MAERNLMFAPFLKVWFFGKTVEM